MNPDDVATAKRMFIEAVLHICLCICVPVLIGFSNSFARTVTILIKLRIRPPTLKVPTKNFHKGHLDQPKQLTSLAWVGVIAELDLQHNGQSRQR